MVWPHLESGPAVPSDALETMMGEALDVRLEEDPGCNWVVTSVYQRIASDTYIVYTQEV